MHQTVGNVLRTLLHGEPPQNITTAKEIVDEVLSIATHARRAGVHSTLGSSPGSLLFNRDLFLNIPLIANWHAITLLSPCWQSILLTTNWHVWYTDEHVVTLLAEHTILLPGRRPHINFRVSVLHLKNVHTIVSSLQNILGVRSCNN